MEIPINGKCSNCHTHRMWRRRKFGNLLCMNCYDVHLNQLNSRRVLWRTAT